MRAVNLLPRDAKSAGGLNSKNLPAIVGAGMGVIVVAALSAGYLSASAKVATAQKALDHVKAQLAATPLPPSTTTTTPVETTPAAVSAEQAPRLQAVSTVLAQRIAWDRILREFSLVLPSDVWIQSLSMTAPTTTATNGFTIQGTTYSYDSVARMLARLNLVPDLYGVTLTGTSGSGRLVTFSIAANIKGGTPPPAPAPVTPPPTDTSTDSTGGTPSS
jgi:Tfp pilus assembly protein PilN